MAPRTHQWLQDRTWDAPTKGLAWWVYLTEHVHLFVLESQLPHKTVNLLFIMNNQNIKSTILWGSWPLTLINEFILWDKKWICKSRFPHKSIQLFFILAKVRDTLTNLWGIWLLEKRLQKHFVWDDSDFEKWSIHTFLIQILSTPVVFNWNFPRKSEGKCRHYLLSGHCLSSRRDNLAKRVTGVPRSWEIAPT